MSETCKHTFTFGGIRYSHDPYPLPGTGAHRTRYWEEYFCTKCLKKRHIELPDTGDNSYGKPQFGATPKQNGAPTRIEMSEGYVSGPLEPRSIAVTLGSASSDEIADSYPEIKPPVMMMRDRVAALKTKFEQLLVL